MGLIYVTGVAGVGKSTALAGLRHRGYEAYGTEEDAIADWINTSSGIAEELPLPGAKFDAHTWFTEHDLVINYRKVQKLKQQADEAGKPIFLCGVADGEDKVWSLFSKVLVLQVDQETLVQRVQERQDNDFGKTPEELQKIINWNANSQANYRQRGAMFIDASQPPEAVLDAIENMADI